MDLPSFTSIRKLRPPRPSPSSTDTTLSPRSKPSSRPSHSTQTHNTLTILTALSYLLALALLLLIQLGNTHDNPVLRTLYFLRLDFSHIIPRSVPNAILINSIARSLGLHDFYQVGIWNYCEGYDGEGITSCGRPRMGYWFNPVEILLDELLAGATIALPSNIVSALSLVRTASRWMSALFLAGTIMTFITCLCIPLALVPLLSPNKSHRPHAHHRRLLATLLTFLTTLTTILTTAATVIATAMFIVFRNVFSSVSKDLNIDAELGRKMFVVMWVGVGFEVLGMGMQWGLGCSCWGCCGSFGCGGGERNRKERRMGRGNGGSIVDDGGGGGEKDEDEKEGFVVGDEGGARRRVHAR